MRSAILVASCGAAVAVVLMSYFTYASDVPGESAYRLWERHAKENRVEIRTSLLEEPEVPEVAVARHAIRLSVDGFVLNLPQGVRRIDVEDRHSDILDQTFRRIEIVLNQVSIIWQRPGSGLGDLHVALAELDKAPLLAMLTEVLSIQEAEAEIILRTEVEGLDDLTPRRLFEEAMAADPEELRKLRRPDEIARVSLLLLARNMMWQPMAPMRRMKADGDTVFVAERYDGPKDRMIIVLGFDDDGAFAWHMIIRISEGSEFFPEDADALPRRLLEDRDRGG